MPTEQDSRNGGPSGKISTRGMIEAICTHCLQIFENADCGNLQWWTTNFTTFYQSTMSRFANLYWISETCRLVQRFPTWINLIDHGLLFLAQNRPAILQRYLQYNPQGNLSVVTSTWIPREHWISTAWLVGVRHAWSTSTLQWFSLRIFPHATGVCTMVHRRRHTRKSLIAWGSKCINFKAFWCLQTILGPLSRFW